MSCHWLTQFLSNDYLLLAWAMWTMPLNDMCLNFFVHVLTDWAWHKRKMATHRHTHAHTHAHTHTHTHTHTHAHTHTLTHACARPCLLLDIHTNHTGRHFMYMFFLSSILSPFFSSWCLSLSCVLPFCLFLLSSVSFSPSLSFSILAPLSLCLSAYSKVRMMTTKIWYVSDWNTT